MKEIFKTGMLGVVVGDALGCPVQFHDESFILSRPCGEVTTMEGYGTFNLPEGSWTDDSSMALAVLDSIVSCGGIDLDNAMVCLAKWLDGGEYTPYGYSYDVGNTCASAIYNYTRCGKTPENCGITGEHANGNGSLMRIMPVVLYAYKMQKAGKFTDAQAIAAIDSVSALTHNHERARMACGIYFFMARAILDGAGDDLNACLQRGMDDAKAFYAGSTQWSRYARMENIAAFAQTPRGEIRSSGYVLDSIEAAVWSLAGTDSYARCTLKTVNLGGDTDTIAAIAGGLAALYYGAESIPGEWLDTIKKLDWIEALCAKADAMEW